MTRTWIRLATALGLAIAVAAASAQDDPLAGVTVEELGGIVPAGAEGQALVLMRITLRPGTTIAPHHHPGTVIVLVDSGRFGTEFTRGEGRWTRPGEEPRTLGVGTEQVLEAGESLAYGGDATHVMTNAGDGPLVLLVSALMDPEQEGFVFHE